MKMPLPILRNIRGTLPVNTKLGNAVFQDTNGDRKIDSYDKVPTGYTNIPELIPTIRLGFSWKGFDARAVLTAYLNRTVPCRENMDYGFGWGGTSTHEITNTWGYYTDDPTDQAISTPNIRVCLLPSVTSTGTILTMSLPSG